MLWWLLVACTPKPLESESDRDGDGVVAREDCDDNDPLVFPGASEACNERDDDCDGSVDEDFAWLVDEDGDGFGSGTPQVFCEPPGEGWAQGPEDCDDTDATIAPDQIERCDGVDNDCNSLVDDAEVMVTRGTTGFSSLDEALASAEASTTLGLCPGEHPLTQGLTIANGEAWTWIGAGPEVVSVLPATDVTAVTLQDGAFTLNGIEIKGAQATVVQVDGAGDVEITGSRFTENGQILRIPEKAGATTFSARSTTFVRNVADATLIDADAPVMNVEFRDCAFTANEARLDDLPLISVWSNIKREASLLVENTTFDDNRTHRGKGYGEPLVPILDALWLSQVTVRDTTFENNVGGGIEASLCTDVDLTRVSLQGRDFSGGLPGPVTDRDVYATALRLDILDTIRLDNVTVEGFTSPVSGGAILCTICRSIDMIDTVLHFNRALQRGGGLWCFNCGDINLQGDCVFSDNEAQEGGGAAFVRGEIFDFATTLIERNVAERGGGLYIDRTEWLADFGSRVHDNVASESGGGIYVQESGASFTSFANFAITENEAPNGGGVFVDFGAAEFATMQIEGNVAERGGGIYVESEQMVSFNGGTVAGNQAMLNGGGLFLGVSADLTALKTDFDSAAGANTPDDISAFGTPFSVDPGATVFCESPSCTITVP
ncbi:MAG: putative metal-binding motif-containing protein [Myxococcota bacterium]